MELLPRDLFTLAARTSCTKFAPIHSVLALPVPSMVKLKLQVARVNTNSSGLWHTLLVYTARMSLYCRERTCTAESESVPKIPTNGHLVSIPIKEPKFDYTSQQTKNESLLKNLNWMTSLPHRASQRLIGVGIQGVGLEGRHSETETPWFH